MKYKLLTTALALIATQSAVAMSDPFPCPTVYALKEVGVSSTMIFDGGPTKEWSGIEKSNQYYTGVDWSFIITIDGLIGKPKNEILARVNSEISNLILQGGPYPFRTEEHPSHPEKAYYCQYMNVGSSHGWALAVTPIWDTKTSLLKLLKR